MTLIELAYQEDNLHSKVIDLYNQSQTEENKKKLKEIFLQYKKIHQSYAHLASRNMEALKRGLFIQWYAQTEPSYLTGIDELNENSESQIVQVLNEVIIADKMDNELIWMLNYYSNFNWFFERYKLLKGFYQKIVNEHNNRLPDIIDREEMKLRGQMGKYWNSLKRFSDA